MKPRDIFRLHSVDKEGIGQDRILLIDPHLRKSNSAEVIIEFAPKEQN